MNKENKIKDFFNKRIKKFGYEKFIAEIAEENISGQMILNFLKENIKNKKKKILDAGCGEGRFSKYFIENGYNITSMDFSEEYLKVAKKNIGKGKFILGSVTNLPFKDNSFNYIFSVDVFQHVPDLEKAIKECHRVLKKDGVLIIIDKNMYGFNERSLIPQKLIKNIKDLRTWKYSGFRERWFSPKKLKKMINKYFDSARFEYLIEKNKNNIFQTFPQLNLFVAWIAKK